MAQTKLAQLVNPQVMADMISAKLPHKLRFGAVFPVDDTLVGNPGDEITVPAWGYIGDAKDITEGEAIPLDQMSTTVKKMKVKQAGKGVEITDVAVLSGLGDPIGQAEKQMLLSIANKIDNDCLATLKTASQSAANLTKRLTVEQLDAAIEMLNEEEEEITMVLFCNPTDALHLKRDAAKEWTKGSELGADMVIRGVFGMVGGAQIVRSRKLGAGEAILVKITEDNPAGKLLLKRDVMVESDRDIVKKTTVITADEHYGTHLYNEKNVVKLSFTKV